MIVIFVLGYVAIATEHQIKVDKAATALVTGMSIWAIYVFILKGHVHDGGHGLQELIEHGNEAVNRYQKGFAHHLFDIANILFFLMGAMTIVEIIDLHRGFEILKSCEKKRKPKSNASVNELRKYEEYPLRLGSVSTTTAQRQAPFLVTDVPTVIYKGALIDEMFLNNLHIWKCDINIHCSS